MFRARAKYEPRGIPGARSETHKRTRKQTQTRQRKRTREGSSRYTLASRSETAVNLFRKFIVELEAMRGELRPTKNPKACLKVKSSASYFKDKVIQRKYNKSHVALTKNETLPLVPLPFYLFLLSLFVLHCPFSRSTISTNNIGYLS